VCDPEYQHRDVSDVEHYHALDLGSVLWTEDTSLYQPADRPTIYTQWKKLFGVTFNKQLASKVSDRGDHYVYWMPVGYLAVCAYNGWLIYDVDD